MKPGKRTHVGPASATSPRTLTGLSVLVAALAAAGAQQSGSAQGGLPAYQEIQLPASTLAGVVPGAGGLLYGVTYEGGANNLGTIFSALTDLSQITVLHSFNGTDGRIPYGELTSDGLLLYGTNVHGRTVQWRHGLLLQPHDAGHADHRGLGLFVRPPESGNAPARRLPVWEHDRLPFRILGVSRPKGRIRASPVPAPLHCERGIGAGHSDGRSWWLLYGPAEFGGLADCYPAPYSGCGTVFRIKPDGSDFEVVYRFDTKDPSGATDEDGNIIRLFERGFPQRKLVFSSDGRLYGTTYRGVFSMTPNPAAPDFVVHYVVPRAQGTQIFAPPIEGLDGRLYINQYDGGDGMTNGVGSVYSMTKTGTDVIPLHLFTLTSGGQGPYGVMYQDSAGTIYGTTEYDETPNSPYHGTLFAIRGSNQAPTAAATAPATVAAGANCLASVTLDGSASSDPNGDPLTYQWRENGSLIATGATPTVSLGVGIHTITLRVSDPAGANNSTTVTVTVTSDVTLTYLGPNLLQSSGSNVLQAQTSTVNGPLAGVQLTFTVNGTPYQATTDASGIASVNVGPIASVSAAITITTTGGSCGTATTTVTVAVNRWPVASGTASAPNVSDQTCTAPVTLDASSSFDLDSDTLTYRWAEGATLLSTLKTPTVTLPAGTHAITLTVNDGRGGTASTIVPAEVLGQAVVLEYTGPAQLTVGIATPVTARLRTAGGVPVVGATIRFGIGAPGNNAGTTDAAGVATANVVAPAVGPATIVVSSTGDTCYQAALISTPITVIAQSATLIVIKTVINDNGGGERQLTSQCR